jgi:hypothetical protein
VPQATKLLSRANRPVLPHKCSVVPKSYLLVATRMTPDEHVREVYAYFGLAVYRSQVLEHGIVNAMVILRLSQRNQFTKTDIDAFMDRQFENTLGKLIRTLRTEMTLPIELEDLLARALTMRNWLCHDYFRESAVEFLRPTGRDRMIEELKAAHDLLSKADKCLESAVQPIADQFGWTEAAFQAGYEALLKEHGI